MAGTHRVAPALPPHIFGVFSIGDITPLHEIKLNGSGSLLFSPHSKFVDLFDAAHGDFRARIELKETVQNVIDCIAIDDDGTEMYLITDAGLTVLDIGALPLSVGSLSATTVSSGTPVLMRGSGFTPGTTVTVNKVAALVSYTDPSTLTFTVPALSKGHGDVALSNSSGESYAMDNALQIQ